MITDILSAVQLAAIIAMGELGDPRAMKPLLGLAYDEFLANRAVEAMTKLVLHSRSPIPTAELRQAAELQHITGGHCVFGAGGIDGTVWVDSPVDTWKLRGAASKALQARGEPPST